MLIYLKINSYFLKCSRSNWYLYAIYVASFFGKNVAKIKTVKNVKHGENKKKQKVFFNLCYIILMYLIFDTLLWSLNTTVSQVSISSRGSQV